MKLFVCILLFTLTLSLCEAFSHSFDSQLISTMDRHNNGNVKMHLEKRKQKKSKSKGNKKKYDHNCKARKCALVLKPCPKDCPLSCGYIDSPDPCCPLLGKPTCPDY